MARLLLGASLLAACLLAAACLPGGAGARTVHAVVENSNNLFVGSEVRVLGLTAGEVTGLAAEGADVWVTMRVRGDVEIAADSRAKITPSALLGERFVALDPAAGRAGLLEDGAVIPLERTAVPAEIDEVLASFERFLEDLDPETVAELVDVAAETLEGQGEGLNALLDDGATTVRVLSEASDDLMTTVSALAQVTETLAAREQRLGPLIEDWSAVAGTIGEESDELVEGIGHLRRLTGELRPLLDRHGEPLADDLRVATTALATAARNQERIGTMLRGGHMLFEGAGRAFDYEHARLRLHSHGDELGQAVADRLANRLVGLCLRVGADECADLAFWRAHLPAVTCLEALRDCEAAQTSLRDALAAALGLLPEEAVEALGEPPPREQRADAGRDDADDGGLPLPDPRLDDPGDAQQDGLRDRVARWLGGG